MVRIRAGIIVDSVVYHGCRSSGGGDQRLCFGLRGPGVHQSRPVRQSPIIFDMNSLAPPRFFNQPIPTPLYTLCTEPLCTLQSPELSQRRSAARIDSLLHILCDGDVKIVLIIAVIREFVYILT